MSLRLHVFQHVAHEALGALESFFNEQGASIAYTRFFAGDKPPALHAFDMLVVLGGPMGVYDEDACPWLRDEKPALKAALDAGKPVLGLCLGAQLMSAVLGGVVTKNAHREIGWWPVEKLPGLEADRAALCFPDRFTTFHWHGDTFSIPPGAVSLFRSEGCAHQGFAWGAAGGKRTAVGLQFHPEITATAMASWIEESLAEGGGDLKPGPYVQAVDTMAGMAHDFHGNHAWMKALCAELVFPGSRSFQESHEVP